MDYGQLAIAFLSGRHRPGPLGAEAEDRYYRGHDFLPDRLPEIRLGDIVAMLRRAAFRPAGRVPQ